MGCKKSYCDRLDIRLLIWDLDFHLHLVSIFLLESRLLKIDKIWSSIGGLLSSYGEYGVGSSMVARVWGLGFGDDVNRSIDREVG